VANDWLIEALRAVDSATLSDAVEGLRLRDRTDGYADLRLRCLIKHETPMVGYAVTFTVDSTTPGRTPDTSMVDDLVAAVAASPQPCVVVSQEVGPSPERGCHMGDVTGSRVARGGAVGIVSGSGIRDLSGLRALGLWGFALGTVVSHGNWTITAVNVDVEVAGLRVSPGDLLHGDEGGLLSVPAGRSEELLELIQEVRERERRIRGDSG
jgi:4-hydroxy-4-methyl-2-oxoglutarate aldolase